MNLLTALILGPAAVGVGMLCFRSELPRRFLTVAAILAVAAGTILLAITPPAKFAELSFPSQVVNQVTLVLEALMALYVVVVGIRARKPLIVALMLAQVGVMGWFEFSAGAHLETAHNLIVDPLSILMGLINGLVGGGICLYSLGYMRDYHEHSHPEVPDRRPMFFAVLFVFMGAMFGLVFANNLAWLFLFWEITTLCSFLLIGYSQTPEAKRNALLALVMNLAGGLAFALAIVGVFQSTGTIELNVLMSSKSVLALLPASLLCFAGITKSAQMPFSRWLLGAMVAPTPVSALLHSSTMVKAGVYLVLRMGPVVAGTWCGTLVALVGSLTFVIASLAAITVSDAKRVLAYSTVANLGLIVLCGGIGTAEAIWAGVLLILFHALAKCLLFLCVGVVEHKVHSRDVEAMSGLIVRMPRVAVMMLIGMAGMFLAPFGMLISKWAVLKAVVDASPLLSVFIVFGSAATLFFWVKWMGKLVEEVEPEPRESRELVFGQSVALFGLSAATILACLFFPWFSHHFIEPYVATLYGHAVSLGQGNRIIMTMMMALVLLFPLSLVPRGREPRRTEAYMGGANLHSGVQFRGAADQAQTVGMGNYYLRGFFDEARLSRWGVLGSAALLAALLVTACL